jgi:hypothetical protein
VRTVAGQRREQVDGADILVRSVTPGDPQVAGAGAVAPMRSANGPSGAPAD